MLFRYAVFHLVFVFAASSASSLADAAVLYGHNGFGGGSELYAIDTDTLTTTLIGSDARPQIPEIELDPSGTIVYGGIKAGADLFAIDATNGLNVDSIAATYPAGFDSVTAMQFVGTTLYGAMTVAGAQADSTMATIDTTTGVITTVGDTLLDPPLGGLAYDDGSATMYGVTTTASFDSQLVTIDLATGVGTPIATVTLNGVAQRALTALTFASDGKLYSVQTAGMPGHLFEINKSTGVATDLGDMGIVVTSLARGPAAEISCDFDDSTTCDIDDLNLMLNEGPIAGGVPVNSGNEQFDLDGNGTINNLDRDLWLADAGSFNGFASPYKLGDANLDGTVDGVDFILWNDKKFTSSLDWDDGNFNGDAVADGQDFILWNDSKFTSSDAVAVPEPTSATVVWLGLLSCVASLRNTEVKISARKRSLYVFTLSPDAPLTTPMGL